MSSLNKLDNEFLQKITQIIEENLEMEKMGQLFERIEMRVVFIGRL